jgi:tripartite-type tricarboxylate transporter receptor subunit TctC
MRLSWWLPIVVVLFAAPAQAEYPDKPIKLIVAFTAGGSPDTTGRRIAQRLTMDLHQQVLVDNRPGAAGNIGAETAARAAPDGYTLFLIANSHTINATLYTKLNYDAVKDFTPICRVTSGAALMVVPPSSSAKTVAEFVALAKSKPGKLNYASGGSGSPAHLSAEAFRLATGIDYVHVPHRGAPEIVRALLADQVDVGFPTFETASGQVAQGTLRALATTGSKRARVLPDVPTMMEALPNGFVLEGWLGLAAPAGTSPQIVEKINAVLFEALKDPAFRDSLESGGNEVSYAGPTEFREFIQKDVAKWRTLIERVGARIE